MECSKVDLPEPFSPVSMIRGWESSTIIGMWKLRLTNTGCPRIFRYMNPQDSLSGFRLGAAVSVSRVNRRAFAVTHRLEITMAELARIGFNRPNAAKKRPITL